MPFTVSQCNHHLLLVSVSIKYTVLVTVCERIVIVIIRITPKNTRHSQNSGLAEKTPKKYDELPQHPTIASNPPGVLQFLSNLMYILVDS